MVTIPQSLLKLMAQSWHCRETYHEAWWGLEARGVDVSHPGGRGLGRG